jgi:hypothetical protein
MARGGFVLEGSGSVVRCEGFAVVARMARLSAEYLVSGKKNKCVGGAFWGPWKQLEMLPGVGEGVQQLVLKKAGPFRVLFEAFWGPRERWEANWS